MTNFFLFFFLFFILFLHSESLYLSAAAWIFDAIEQHPIDALCTPDGKLNFYLQRARSPRFQRELEQS